MAGLLLGVGTTQTPIDDKSARKRIGPRIGRSGSGWLRWSSNFRHVSFVESAGLWLQTNSINVALVTFVALQLLDELVRRILALAALSLNDFPQRGVHILG